MKTNFSGEYKVEKFCEGKDVTLFGAFPEGASITFRVSLPRKYASLRSEIILFSDFGEAGRFPLEWKKLEGSCDIYEGTVENVEKGLYFYRIVFGIKWGERSVPNYRDGGDVFQLTFYDPEFKSAKWLNGGIMYQVFTDRFRSGKDIPLKKGTILNEDWYDGIPQYAEKPGDPVANNMFFGGDLYGIAEKMDYIASLGVTVLYLNPIFDAASNHKYDIGDYMKIDSMFGGEEGFNVLLKAAEKHGIKVILDGVFNHTGDDSKYFNRYGNYDTVGAYQSEKSKYKDWYNFRNYPDDYESWWGVTIMPSTNKDNPEYRDFINGKNGVVRHYLKKGISGWRLDVADELHDGFLKELHDAALEEKSDALIIGEVWEDASNKVAYDKRRRYFIDGELDSVMNYPIRNAVISYMLHGDAENIAAVTSRLYEHYPKQVSDNLTKANVGKGINHQRAHYEKDGQTHAAAAEFCQHQHGDDCKAQKHGVGGNLVKTCVEDDLGSGSEIEEGRCTCDHQYDIVPGEAIGRHLILADGESQKADDDDHAKEHGKAHFGKTSVKQRHADTVYREEGHQQAHDPLGCAYPHADIGFTVILFHDRFHVSGSSCFRIENFAFHGLGFDFFRFFLKQSH